MALPTFRLDGKVILVTGAGSGIGAGIAVALSHYGAAVGCLDISREGLTATVEEIEKSGGKALAVVADVCDEESIENAVSELESAFGPLNGALNCAGIHNTAPAEDMSRAQWQKLIDINLTGVFLSSQAEGRALIRNGGGNIVNIGSISAHIANRGLTQAHYNAAKAGVAHLSRSLALEWADHNIRVNVISPGYTATRMAKTPEVYEMVKHLLDDVPLHRMCEVDELVGPAVFLLSEASSYCTGVDIVVDGGAIRW